MTTKQAKLPAGSVMAAITQAVTIGQQLLSEQQALIEKIKEQASKQVDAKNAADAASTERKGLWSNVLLLAEHVAAAAPTKDTREMVFNIVAAELLESETANTAKMYASTARAALVKLHTEQGKPFDALHEMSYGDIRKELKPANNPDADNRIAELTKKLKFLSRKGDKVKVSALLDALEEFTAAEYNPVKGEADKASAAAKAAKELEANRQNAPAAPAATETVAKPEAVAI